MKHYEHVIIVEREHEIEKKLNNLTKEGWDFLYGMVFKEGWKAYHHVMLRREVRENSPPYR